MKTSSQVKVGLVQMSMNNDREENVSKAVRMISKASAEGADVVCLPELFDSLYFPQHEKAGVLPQTIPGPVTRRLSDAARKYRVVIVGGSLYETDGSNLYNTSVVFDERGSMIGKYRKIHLPHDPSFYEQNYFSPGTRYEVVATTAGKIGVLICFDQWYPEPARANKLLGAQILFYPSAIGWVRGVEPIEGDWHEAWESVQRGHAIANSIVVASVNRVGVENEMSFWGGSFVCDQFGKVLIRGDDSEGVLVATCRPGMADEIEAGWGFLRNRRPDTYGELCKKR